MGETPPSRTAPTPRSFTITCIKESIVETLNERSKIKMANTKNNAATNKEVPAPQAAPAKQRELPSAVYEMGIGGGPKTTLQKILYPICVVLLLSICYNSFDVRELHFTRFRQGMYDLPPLDFRAHIPPPRYYKPKKVNLHHTEWKDGHDFCPTPW